MHDLVRAGAQSAASIVLMLSNKDAAEAEASGGMVRNGGTIASLLALRHVLFASTASPIAKDLRVTVHLSEASEHAEAAA